MSLKQNVKDLRYVGSALMDLHTEGKLSIDDFMRLWDSLYNGNKIPFSGFDLRRKAQMRKVLFNADYASIEKRIKHRHCAKCVYNKSDGCKSPGCPWNEI